MRNEKKSVMLNAVLILHSEDFHRLIVMILAWNFRFQTLVRLKYYFKRRIRRKETLFCFCLICTVKVFGKKKKFWFWESWLCSSIFF